MSKSTALIAGASVGALAVVLTRPTNGNGKISPPNGRVAIGPTPTAVVSQPRGAIKMKAVFQVLNDDGTQAMDSVTGEPHAFDFPVSPEAYAVIEAWMAGQGTTDAEGVVVPKWRNMGQLAAQFLYAGGGGFKAMLPPEATADLDQIVKDAVNEKETRLAAMFGVVA